MTIGINFPDWMLSHILNDIACNGIDWLPESVHITGDICFGLFKWYECTWKICEVKNDIFSINLCDGDLNNQNLTFLALKGKIA